MLLSIGIKGISTRGCVLIKCVNIEAMLAQLSTWVLAVWSMQTKVLYVTWCSDPVLGK